MVLCHDDSVDPILVFANRAARDLWEAPLVGMPSRLTAPPEQRTEMFGLFALTGKVTAFLGPALVAVLTAASGSQRVGMAAILLLFLVGLVILWPLKAPPRRG